MDDYKDLFPQNPVSRFPDTEQDALHDLPWEEPSHTTDGEKETMAEPTAIEQERVPGMAGNAGSFVSPPESPITMNRRIYTMTAVIAVLIFLLCMYCIVSDLMHGALGEADVPVTGSTNVYLTVGEERRPDKSQINEDGSFTAAGVAEVVTPSIVEVYAYADGEEGEELHGSGSGIVLTEDGYILTNAHVVQDDHFSVITSEGEEYDAVIVGSDTKTDLAVLKVDARRLTAASFGDSDTVYVGQDVLAIGNPAGLKSTVTRGIVSAVNRPIRAESTAFVMECIQTDAAISPGNSGGALVDMYGQVIGITSSKYVSANIEGLGFAISSNQALPIVSELIEQGYVSGRFRIGISFLSTSSSYARYMFEEDNSFAIPEEISGLWIKEISEDCDIANTELKVNDFILSMNDIPVADYTNVMDILEGFEGGDTVKAECARVEGDGEVSYFTIEFKLETDTSGNY